MPQGRVNTVGYDLIPGRTSSGEQGEVVFIVRDSFFQLE